MEKSSEISNLYMFVLILVCNYASVCVSPNESMCILCMNGALGKEFFFMLHQVSICMTLSDPLRTLKRAYGRLKDWVS